MASTLRRRAVAAEEPVEPPSPASTTVSRDDGPVNPGEGLELVLYPGKPPARKRKSTFIFFLGSLFGIIAAGFLAQNNELINLPELVDLNVESFLDVLPAAFVKDMRDLVNGEREYIDSYDSFSVGNKAKAEGLDVHHPIIMIPGVISTALESWGTTNVSRPYFRRRLWGSWTMMRALVMDKEQWKRHIMLDKITGLDPPGIKLRAAYGFDATDFFITGYWIWNKIFENLASLGYDPTNSFTAAYDWRLSYPNLEKRDQYFTRLKIHIEMAHEFTGKKVVLASHSMGGQVVYYFFNWVSSDKGGRGGDSWVDEHIEAWINISGCMLGAAKAIPAVLSGEMRDTAQLNAFAVYGLDKFLSKDERAEMFRAMPGISSMLPIGGERIWGNLTWAPDDRPGQVHSYGSYLNFRLETNWTTPTANFTVGTAVDYLLNVTEDWYEAQIKRSYSHQGVADTSAEVEKNMDDPVKWINPLETRLPLAPNLKIYCFYGVGKPTERAYYYRTPDPSVLTNLNITIDTGLTTANIDHGVIMGEGDGTVGLLSAGYMCNRGWNLKRHNPAGVKITVYEMPHEPDRFSPRGGPNTADHVDILGRQGLNELVLRVAAGKGNTINNNIVSDIKKYAANIKIFEEDEEGHVPRDDSETGQKMSGPQDDGDADEMKGERGGEPQDEGGADEVESERRDVSQDKGDGDEVDSEREDDSHEDTTE